MRLLLTHADTPFRMWREELDFSSPELQLSLPALYSYERVHLTLALWCDHRLDGEAAWQEILAMRRDAQSKLSHLPSHISVSYALEDARPLLTHTEERVEWLWQSGIRTVTPFWRGANGLGGGYDTRLPLTQVGKDLIRHLHGRGMWLDISHASRESACEMLSLCHGRILASHSNFYAACPHPRNLTDGLALAVAKAGGVIGISFVPSHLGEGEDALLRQIDHACRLGLAEHLCLGTDFDGTDTLPPSLARGAADLISFGELLSRSGYTDAFLQGLFWQNAARALAIQ